MVYLNSFIFPNEDMEFDFIIKIKRMCYDPFYPDYVNMCRMSLEADIHENSRIITSDDVFDYMLNIRNLNEGIDPKREKLFGIHWMNLRTVFL